MIFSSPPEDPTESSIEDGEALFDLAELISSVDYSTYSDARAIRKHPIGFENEDVEMAKPPIKENIKAFLRPDDLNERDYQISVAFIPNPRGGHAAVVLRDYDLDDANPPFESIFRIHKTPFGEYRGPSPGGYPTIPLEDNLRLLHLRLAPKEPKKPRELELALEIPSGPVEYYRHVDLYRVRTTERVLKHIALQSCPGQHRVLVDDCATFVYNFSMGLLRYLVNDKVIEEEVLKSEMKRLIRNNHIKDGLIGESEPFSRDHEGVDESVHTSAVVSGSY